MGRPEEVAWWLKRGRKYKGVPPIKKLNDYTMAWQTWWKGLQPDGRKADPQAWSLPRCDLTAADWSSLAHVGPTGLLLVVVSLAWWGYYVKGEGQMEEFLVAVEDVLWALTQMAGSPPPKPKAKHNLDHEDDEPKNKK